MNFTFGLEVVDIEFGLPTQTDVHNESSRGTIGALISILRFFFEWRGGTIVWQTLWGGGLILILIFGLFLRDYKFFNFGC